MSVTAIWLIRSYLRFLIRAYEDLPSCYVGEVKLGSQGIDSKNVITQ